MAVTDNGRFIRCDQPGCETPELEVPPHYLDGSDDLKRDWAETRYWISDQNEDVCPTHAAEQIQHGLVGSELLPELVASHIGPFGYDMRDKYVVFRGSPATEAAAILFTLPHGHRPVSDETFVLPSSEGPVAVVVTAAGLIVVEADTDWTDFTHVTFEAARVPVATPSA